ncbi:hypothetical protein ACROYT_G012824 [Oculina patagonica]
MDYLSYPDVEIVLSVLQKNFAMRTTIFLVLGVLLMFSLNLEVEAYCQTNGCSIPGNLPYFYKRRFTPACNKHDVCYACGVSNRWSRYQCDRAFYRDMVNLCRSLGWVQRRVCSAAARDYYNAVRLFGSRHYENPSLWWCRYCPRRNGAPYVSLGR